MSEELRKGDKRKARRKGKIYPTECRVPENRRRDKKTFLNKQRKEVEENKRLGKTRDLLIKLETSRENFMQGWA